MSAPDVRAMFDRIAPRYDLANRVMSAGVDLWWRRRAVALLQPQWDERLLDLACGTGDCSREILRRQPGARLFGLDFAREMLRRYQPGACVQADALALPVRTGALDGAICAFGLRNVADLPQALFELARALRPGGRLLVLEFFRSGRRLAVNGLARLLGKLVSGDRAAYEYLFASIRSFHSTGEMVDLLQGAGFGDVAVRPLFPQGIATIVKGVRA